MNLALVIITDGRQAMLDQGLTSLDLLDADFAQVVVADDSGDARHARWLERRLPNAEFIHHPQRQGLAAAIRSAWSLLDPTTDYVLHLEDDIVFTGPPPIAEWIYPLTVDPQLAQVVLRRSLDDPNERDAVEAFEAVRSAPVAMNGWSEVDWLFSLQPSIYPYRIVEIGWPEHGGETEFTNRLPAGTRFAQLGHAEDAHYCHVGFGQRSAGWTL